MQNSMSRVDVTRLGALALIWGASFLFIKVAVEGMTDLQVVLIRTWLGAAALLTLVLLRRLPVPQGIRLWGHLLVIGGIGNALPFFLFAWAENGRISSGLAGIYNGTTPLFTMVLAMAFLSAEPATLARGIGLLVGFAGVVVVLAPWQGSEGSSLAGQVACLAAAASYGVALVWNRRFLPSFGYPPYSLALGQVAAAGLVTTVISLLGVFGTGIAFFLLYALMDRIGATRASMVTYLVPLVAVALGVLVLGESVSWHHFVGGAVVLLGIMIAERRLPLLAARRRPAMADLS
jgi:drug/metabolite transporter (DMT)-like permease